MANFCKLPEGCISNVLSFTSPKDACTSSLVSSTFRSAAESDVVWENFLPSDYKDIISRSISPSLFFPSKKQLYFHLCDHPILIDGGNKSFSLEKLSGKKCYMIGARGLSIIWGDTPRYWRWKSLPESRFEEVAELLLVCWLEIHGRIETQILSPKTNYASYLVFKYAEYTYGLDEYAIEVTVGFVGGRGSESRNVYFDPDGSRRRQEEESRRRFDMLGITIDCSFIPPKRPLPIEREDGWMEIKMGEFFNERGEDGEVEMKLLEVKGLNGKGGLIIHGIEIRPKGV